MLLTFSCSFSHYTENLRCLRRNPDKTHVNNGTPASDPLSSFSCCDDGDTEPASCSDPRTASCYHGAERCGRRPLPSRTPLPSYTPHTKGASPGTASWPFAKLLRSLCSQRAAPLPGAWAYASRSTSVLTEPVQHTRGACTVPLVS